MVFNNARCREFLGIMKHPPPDASKKQPRPGIHGFILDQKDQIQLAFKNYIEDAEDRRRKFNQIGRSVPVGDVKYETRHKGPADTRARQAGMIEKLK